MSDLAGRRHALRSLGKGFCAILALPLLRALYTPRPISAAEAATVRPEGDEMKQGDSGIQDPFRLPRHVIPTRYELRLEPDLPGATFAGQVTVFLTVTHPTNTVVCNAVDLGITKAEVVGANGERFSASIQPEEALQRCRLVLPVTLSPGPWRLCLTFHGTLNDKLQGFYRSTYKDPAGSTHTIAATQFEATDARRAFPCWDEPDFKAVFATTLVIDPQMTAVSNSRVLSDEREGAKRVVRFTDTIKMSTYLVAFIVGRIEATAPTLVGRTPLRLWAVPGKQHLTHFGQEIAAASLRFLEEYYGIPYPGDKLDLLAIPDFASGAMENLGAITFRETALLVDQRSGTHGELERVADVVAHENAHMWFGDLVTMSWWNGLWLNEAFATFMEMMAVDAWKPDWKRWETFSVSRAAAFSVDGLHATRPIEYPVRAPKDADAMFDVLTYEKGASVLRMLEQHIGPVLFRDGVRDYLRTHAYGNADTKDLWVSLGKAANQPVPELMDAWIFQPGFPLVTAELTSNSDLTLSQRRFSYLPDAPASLWHVPLQLRSMEGGAEETRRILLTESHTTVPLGQRKAVVVNAGSHGFYRVQYGPKLLSRLLDHGIPNLPATERFSLLNDTWATTVAGLFPLDQYLDFTRHFQADRDKNVWAVLIDSFHFLNRVIDPADRMALAAFVRATIQPAAEAVGWAPQPDEHHLTKQLRSELIGALGKLGNDQATQQRAEEWYTRSRRQPSAVDPNLLPALVSILAFTGDAGRYDEFVDRFKTADTPQQERRYLLSLAGFTQPGLLERTLAHTLDGTVRVQDAPFLISAVMGSVYGKELGWTFVKTNWDRMDRVFPKQGLRRMCGGITGLATSELERDVREFFARRNIDLGGKTLDQYLEQLRITVRFKEQQATALHNYLQATNR